jgi:hypothetical protein
MDETDEQYEREFEKISYSSTRSSTSGISTTCSHGYRESDRSQASDRPPPVTSTAAESGWTNRRR